ncbi:MULTISPECIES: hypothetical protein [unclassified Streptomyces]|uniref:hypothetical protein n=1 Tax=unclassified Streptomyces TaxID=2593676 RepID=UPI002DD8CA04|nr:hypothetical protein [Streptomyces sp. NBC_01763]
MELDPRARLISKSQPSPWSRDVYQDRRTYVWNNDHDTATLRDAHGRTIDSTSWGYHRGGRDHNGRH